jgi:hypothetical protein
MSATADLAASRAQLLLELAKNPASQGPSGAMDALASGLIDRFLGQKPKSTVSDIQAIAATLIHTTLEPIAREKPLQLVAGAAAIGALLVWSRPWHWFDRGAVARLMVPMIVARVLATKTQD